MAKKKLDKKEKSRKGMPSRKLRGSNSKSLKKKRRLGQFIITIFLWILFLAFSCFVWLWYDLPDLNKVRIAQRRPYIEFLDVNRDPLISYGDRHLSPVKLKNISPFITKAILAIEDHRFYEHKGIDFVGLARAFMINVYSGTVQQGGSTLTQQLAKTLFLSPRRSIKRKLQEIIVSIWLESNFSKNQILRIYLNRVYMGPGLYGFAAASRYYFKKDLRALNLWEAAGLAGMLKAPHTYSPFRNLERFKERARVVLMRMETLGYIKETAAQRAQDKLLDYKLTPSKNIGSSVRYFTDWIYRELRRHIPDLNQDLIVLTTYSPKVQKLLNLSLRTFVNNPSLNKVQIAMVSMGREGNVQGMIGGREYFSSSFNRSFQAKRQTGSIFKLFVYIKALISGMHTTDKIKDTPIRLGNWHPRNYSWKPRGYLSMADAFAYSINTATVRIAQQLGVRSFLELAQDMGAIKKLPKKVDLTMSLGTLESSLLSLTSCFSTISNKGILIEPFGILEIRSSQGKILYRRKSKKGKRLFSKKVSGDIKEMLEKAIRYGTGKKAYIKGHATYGKTGTTQDHRDAWFIGFDNSHTLGIWMGSDDNTPLPNKMTGGNLPAKLWRQVISNL